MFRAQGNNYRHITIDHVELVRIVAEAVGGDPRSVVMYSGGNVYHDLSISIAVPTGHEAKCHACGRPLGAE